MLSYIFSLFRISSILHDLTKSKQTPLNLNRMYKKPIIHIYMVWHLGIQQQKPNKKTRNLTTHRGAG